MVSKFLILSEGGDGTGLALRLTREGHDVALWIREGSQEKLGFGLVEHSSSFEAGQTVIADCTGFGTLLDKFRESDVKTFGGSSFADKLESDRGFSEEVMHRAEIDTPKSFSVQSWDDAVKAIDKTTTEKVVLKPEGGMSGVGPSQVAKSHEEAHLLLKRFEKEHAGGQVELTIQEFIEGFDVSTEGWFNGEDWIDGLFNHTLERKQLMNENLGPSGGCTGNIVWSCDSKDPIVKYLLIPLTDTLRKHRYVGPIDINCVINDKGFYALEFTPRFGYDAFPTFLHTLFRADFGSFVADVCRGDDLRVALPVGFGCGVRLSIPPWPSKGKVEQVSVRGFTEKDKDTFYPYGVMLDGEELKSCGEDGSLGVISCFGGSISEGFARCYDVISRLEVPNLQYRTDLAHAFLKDFRNVQCILRGDSEPDGWIGVDLDGTLANYSGWSTGIGAPIGKMVQRVKRWVAEGREVRILTARGATEPKQNILVHDWINEHIRLPLFVTDKKDYEMIRLYDDRVRQVEANTG